MKLNCSLNYEDYSWSNALLWGNCAKHFKKAFEGSLGDRVVHFLIFAAELAPIVSQIVSIFEMIILRPSEDRPHQEMETFEKFKARVSSEENIKLQRLHRTSCKELQPIAEKNVNPPIKLTKAPEGIEFFAQEATFYGYSAEGIDDHGWGCAWRAIQTCLSSYGLKIPLETLFHTLGPLENLKRIYKDKYPSEDLASPKKFAPYELSSGWTEPFVGEMALHFYGISANLERVNGIPRGCSTPESVFHNQSLSFLDFRQRLEKHFQKEKERHAAPIMIDDGAYTLSIIGIGRKDANTTLWIADPHIRQGANRNIGDKTPNGLYRITLNELGEQMSCSLSDVDNHQVPHVSTISHSRLHFKDKHWMVLFPLNNERSG